MRALGVRRGGGAQVRGGDGHRQPVGGQVVDHVEIHGPRVAGLGHQPVEQRHRVRAELLRRPRRPPGQPVAGVVAAHLRQGQLELAAAERVATVLDPVGPRQQQLPAAGRGVLVLRVARDDGAPVVLEEAQARAALGDHRAVATSGDLELLAARRDHGPLPLSRAHTLPRKSAAPCRAAPLVSARERDAARPRPLRHPRLEPAARRGRERRPHGGALQRGRPRGGDVQPGHRARQGPRGRLRRRRPGRLLLRLPALRGRGVPQDLAGRGHPARPSGAGDRHADGHRDEGPCPRRARRAAPRPAGHAHPERAVERHRAGVAPRRHRPAAGAVELRDARRPGRRPRGGAAAPTGCASSGTTTRGPRP